MIRKLLCVVSVVLSFVVAPTAQLSAHEGGVAPTEFIRNDGQWEGPFKFRATIGNVELFLEKNAFTYLVGEKDILEKQHQIKYGTSKDPVLLKYHAYRLNIVGANPDVKIEGAKSQPHYYNYYLSNDSTKWKSYIHPDLAVDYTGIYPNVNLHIASEGRNIKYDFIVQPGGDAAQIQLSFDGVDGLDLKKGNLVISTSVGEIYEMAPYAYQYSGGERIEVPCNYRLRGNTITYQFPKGYDKSVPLVIDPNVIFSTFSGSTARNWGFTATYDDAGNFYAGGVANGSGYPTNLGPSFAGGDAADSNGASMITDMTITKFNPAGNALVYSTFLGGSSQDQPHSMVTNAAGELYLAGRTYSANFPIPGNTSSHSGGADIIVARLSAAGILQNARFVGGSADDGVNISSNYSNIFSLKHSYADDARSEIILDNAGNVYVAGCTKSANFPTANPAKSGLTGLQDGVAFKLNNNLSAMLWGTYIGGSDVDAAYVLALSQSEASVYVAGGTASNNFTGSGGLWNSYQGGSADGFIQKYENGGSYGVQRATLIGRGGYDQVFGIQVDAQNSVYVMGQTLGGTFPVTAGVYNNPSSSQFLMKLDSNISSNVYSTVYGSGNSSTTNITPVAFLVDTCQNVYISGWGGSVSGNGGNTQNMPVSLGNPPPTPSGIVSATTDGSDFYFIVFSRNAAALLFAAYFGGSQIGEHVDGGTSRFDKNGVVYQAICGGCFASSNVPTTPGAFSNVNGSSDNCNLMALKIAFNLGSVKGKIDVQPGPKVCLGEPFTFSGANSSNATTYDWDFGNGATANGQTVTYTYPTGGSFTVRLIVTNPNACRTVDTAYLAVTVDTNSIDADFSVTTTEKCKPYIATITNNSKGRGSSTSYQWTFGDGTTFSGANPGAHTYADTGTYVIKLVISDAGACNTIDSVTKVISFNEVFVKAVFAGPPLLCENAPAQFSNNSENAATYLWDFGDGNTSNAAAPKHLYDTAGTYVVKFYAYNPLTCNGVDSSNTTVTVSGKPKANFRHSPIIPVTNEPVTFQNLSERATAYVWDFGDNTFSDLITPLPKYYRRTGTYRVCLQALNEAGCSDTICRNVDADVYPLADLPKAFSPNGDGVNDILYVRGSGIETLDLTIYNRWGEIVFETTDINIGWDGTYKGKEQPIEAYAYVMNVVFVDGINYYKKGNVTLLR